MDKLLYGFGITGILGAVLCYSWHLGIDGAVTTAIIGLMGAISGTILGFAIGKNQA
jgi:hypothetical protein